MTKPMQNKVAFITGSTRGVGRAMALKLAAEGAAVVITGKTKEPHPKLPGTIYSVAKEVEQLGGRALPLCVDVRDEAAVTAAMKQTVETFGGLDILVNNASALVMTGTEQTDMKRVDLMFGVNVRGTFMCSKIALPYLKERPNSHILNIAPPLSMQPKWFKNHVFYTISKYGMSMCTLGMAEEFKSMGVAVNSLWPKTILATSAIEFNFPPEIMRNSRHATIMADAAFYILSQPSTLTGNFFLDEEIIKKSGVEDLSMYAVDPAVELIPDFFVD